MNVVNTLYFYRRIKMKSTVLFHFMDVFCRKMQGFGSENRSLKQVVMFFLGFCRSGVLF